MPSESAEADPSTATLRPVGLAVKDATGATLFRATVTVWVTVLVAPLLSVTVSAAV